MNGKLYNTRGRDLLLRYLAESADRPQGTDEMYAALKGKENAPGKSSIYRMLTQLCEQGAVKKFRADSKGQGFVYQFVGNASHCGDHFHLQCTACGQIVHLECAFGQTLRTHLLSEHGFTVDSGSSVLYGTCAACLGRERDD